MKMIRLSDDRIYLLQPSQFTMMLFKATVGYSLMITNTFRTEQLNLSQTHYFNILTFDQMTCRGSDQMLISTKFEQRDDLSVVRNYGKLLLDVVSTVPDGVCCFFTR